MAKKKKIKRKVSRQEVENCFEDSLRELETIVAELESGELGLTDALERYERGIGRLKQCHAQLAQAARKIEILSGIDAAGNPITRPFDEVEFDSLEEKQAARSRRRGATGQEAGVDDGPRLF